MELLYIPPTHPHIKGEKQVYFSTLHFVIIYFTPPSLKWCNKQAHFKVCMSIFIWFILPRIQAVESVTGKGYSTKVSYTHATFAVDYIRQDVIQNQVQ